MTRAPPAIAPPEPLLSRSNVEYQLVATLPSANSETWTIVPWRIPVFDEKYKKKPAYELVLYANAQSEGDLAEHLESTPLEDAAERKDIDLHSLESLPTVLRILNEGNDTERVKMLTNLHKRLYHRKADELRTILRRSGLPTRLLALCEEAVEACELCRRWQKIHAKPTVKLNLSKRFNHMVYGDLIFVGEPTQYIFLVLVDDCIRWTGVSYVEFKDFTSLEKAFRQNWVSRFGPPHILRSDREGTLAADQFGIYLEKIGTKRELVTAGEHHGFLGPLDRKVQIIRSHVPL